MMLPPAATRALPTTTNGHPQGVAVFVVADGIQWVSRSLASEFASYSVGDRLTQHAASACQMVFYPSRDGGIRTRDPLNPIHGYASANCCHRGG
jgi:hypothetical protein